jgi:hypothetical protein
LRSLTPDFAFTSQGFLRAAFLSELARAHASLLLIFMRFCGPQASNLRSSAKFAANRTATCADTCQSCHAADFRRFSILAM